MQLRSTVGTDENARDATRPKAFPQASANITAEVEDTLNDGPNRTQELAGDGWVDRLSRDNRGEILGVVVDVYDDPDTRHPTWLAISTGYFGTRITVVPISGCSLLGEDVVVAHDRSTITSAPAVEINVTVAPEHHRRLIEHYVA